MRFDPASKVFLDTVIASFPKTVAKRISPLIWQLIGTQTDDQDATIRRRAILTTVAIKFAKTVVNSPVRDAAIREAHDEMTTEEIAREAALYGLQAVRYGCGAKRVTTLVKRTIMQLRDVTPVVEEP